MDPDHLSAYALIVEPGTALARRVARGEVRGAGRRRPGGQVRAGRRAARDRPAWRWYEVSNWARDQHAWCRHNLGYWQGSDWWGIGPGAHSHVGGVRWWNVKHPAAYADRIAAGAEPGPGA